MGYGYNSIGFFSQAVIMSMPQHLATTTAAMAALAGAIVTVALFPSARAFTASFARHTAGSVRVKGGIAASNTANDSSYSSAASGTDPYAWLEEVESEESLAFAMSANDACIKALGDPETSFTGTYERVLASLQSDGRIPHVRKYGTDEEGEDILFNFWKDSSNPKGLWRRTTLSSFRGEDPEWVTVLDLDALAKMEGVSWVWKGTSLLPRARDPLSDNGRRVTRCLMSLSRGGADATFLKEFDLVTEDFVSPEEGGFALPEAKTRASYRSRDVLSIGSDFGPDSLTDSGYPRTVREWVRGTEVEDASVVFEGEKSDVSVGAYVTDQRFRNGSIYEVRYRSLTFYTKKYWVRKVSYEHLLAPDDIMRQGVDEPPEFVSVDVPDDAGITFFANYMLISLRSDWTVASKTFPSGSFLYVDAETFLSGGKDVCEYGFLFEPTETTSFKAYTATRNYIIVKVLDTVKDKLMFYKLHDHGSLDFVGANTAKIRAVHTGAIDPYDGDAFWLTTSSYTQPSTLYYADATGVERDAIGNVSDSSYVVEKLKSLPSMYDSEGLIVEQRFTTSKDGTEVPYFVVCKDGMTLDGSSPTLVYGYGGFEISLGPKYISTVGLAWLERGGVYVEANIRGGGEFGPKWHQAALKKNRNKSYEDFIAICEDLISRKVCKPQTLAIRGGSNGGLLMGNMYVMRPDLFGAIHCAVPLLDMKKYNKLLAGASWQAEYGNPDTEDWDYLESYSPFHNIDPSNDKYPPILLTTSTLDDRVHPYHARAMVKKLWDLSDGKDWPVYYYENVEGGHGGAADSKQSAFMTSLAYDFMFDACSKDGFND